MQNKRTYADALANSLFAFSNLADLFLARLEDALADRGHGLKYEKKALFKRIFGNMKSVSLDYERIQEALWQEAGNIKNFEESQEEDNYTARVWLLFYDRILGDPRREAELFDWLQSQPSRGYVADYMLDNFYLKH